MRWIGVLCLGLFAAGAQAAPLPKLKIDAHRVAVSGLSSGAYMATQMQMAYPDIFPYAAIVAGGPYACANGKLDVALSTCMKGAPAADVPTLVTKAIGRADAGDNGALKYLAHGKVYLLHGKEDATVAPAVAEAGAQFYKRLRDTAPGLKGLQVVDDGDRAFAHNLPLREQGDDCHKSVSPYLGHCGFDAAGEVFAQLFGKPLHAVGDAKGQLQTFNQDAYRVNGADPLLAEEGYLYVPPACAAGKPCGLLVAFHGCKQNAAAVGEAFVKDAGFNRWADAYDVAVLYPQTRASMAPLNPQACWDWWGYSGSDYDTRAGVQPRWVAHVVEQLGVAPKH
ncbi:PHB depolymerase family esterase [Dyella sp.]|uniref:extracellular catalytic domain type 2 short-chain-length polyhydroxyalkanoate depolymerase n=1 Tax=Dyella sp. TaxID=1869338 RepID=UPI002ED4137A